MPAAAKMPDWRMPPPSIFRHRRARWMKSREPVNTLPMGAPRPLDRQAETESNNLPIASGAIPPLTAALKILAPSRWNRKLCSAANALASDR